MVLTQLERVLSSPRFARNQRRSRFLRYLVEQHLAGCDSVLKESVIGTEVFGRKPDYNPKTDAIVRAEARRVRTLRGDYYAGEGKGAPIVIELPKGGYVPVIRHSVSERKAQNGSRWRQKVSVAGMVVVIAAGLLAVWAMRRSVSSSAGTPKSPRPRLGQNQRNYESSQAYALYVRAQAAYHAGEEIADTNIGTYQEAIDKDRSFAPGYAGLAAALAFDSSRPIGIRKDGLINMQVAAEKAIQLDPLLPQAHEALGVVYARLGEWTKSQHSFSRAIELDPKASTPRLDLAMNFLMPLGWTSDALWQVRTAEESDPHSPDVQDAYAYILICAGEFNEAEEHCRKSVNSAECLGRIRIGQGRTEEAIQVLKTVSSTRYLGYAYGRAGRREEAEKLAAISGGALQRVLIYAGLGDKNRTIESLERMIELGPVRVGRALTFPELSFLRGDSRIKDLRKKAGLPEQFMR
jgi:tetratricopeptide (TPR) repeat protein